MILFWGLRVWPLRGIFSIHAYSFLECPALDLKPWFILKHPWELWVLISVVSLSGLGEIQRTAKAHSAYILVRCASRCVLETGDMWVNKLSVGHLWGMWETLTNRLGSRGKDHHRWKLSHVLSASLLCSAVCLLFSDFCLFAYAFTCRHQTPDPSAFARELIEATLQGAFRPPASDGAASLAPLALRPAASWMNNNRFP